jgi:class 3 adenylate cyclase
MHHWNDEQGGSSRTTTRRLAAILAADVVGFSRLVGEDEAGTLSALREIRREIVNPLLAEHGAHLQADG